MRIAMRVLRILDVLASSETDMITGQVISPNSGEVIVGY